jgi:hypothetical protein
VFDVAALADDSSDEVDGDTDESTVEAAVVSCADVELAAAAQATFRTDCTPLLSQFESNVSAAAFAYLSDETLTPGELGWSYFADQHSRNLRQGSSVSLPDRPVGIYKRYPCCCMPKVQRLRCRPSVMKLSNTRLWHHSGGSKLTEHDG